MSVTLVRPGEKEANAHQEAHPYGQDAWLKRQAIQIAAQLPENEADANKVLDYARVLVGFIVAGTLG